MKKNTFGYITITVLLVIAILLFRHSYFQYKAIKDIPRMENITDSAPTTGTDEVTIPYNQMY